MPGDCGLADLGFLVYFSVYTGLAHDTFVPLPWVWAGRAEIFQVLLVDCERKGDVCGINHILIELIQATLHLVSKHDPRILGRHNLILTSERCLCHTLHFIAKLEDKVPLGFRAISSFTHAAQIKFTFPKLLTNLCHNVRDNTQKDPQYNLEQTTDYLTNC